MVSDSRVRWLVRGGGGIGGQDGVSEAVLGADTSWSGWYQWPFRVPLRDSSVWRMDLHSVLSFLDQGHQ